MAPSGDPKGFQVQDARQTAAWFTGQEPQALLKRLPHLNVWFPEEQIEQLVQQFEGFLSQGKTFQAILDKQDSLLAELRPNTVVKHEESPPAVPGPPPVHRPPADAVPSGPTQQPAAAKLTPMAVIGPLRKALAELGMSGDEVVMTVFPLTSQLDEDELRALALVSELSLDKVTQTFNKSRTNVSNSLQRAQDKAAKGTQGLHPMRSAATPEGQVVKVQLERLSQLVDSNNHLRASPETAALFMALMQEASVYEVMEALLSCLAVSPPAAILCLPAQALEDQLFEWVSRAEAEQQRSFLRNIAKCISAVLPHWAEDQRKSLSDTLPAIIRSSQPRLITAGQQAAAKDLVRSSAGGLQDDVPSLSRALAARFTPRHVSRTHAGSSSAAPGTRRKARASAIPSGKSRERSSGGSLPAAEQLVRGGKAAAQAGGSKPAAAPAHPPKPSLEERAAALAVPLGRQQQQQPLPRLGSSLSKLRVAGPEPVFKPLSADDIRRQRERQAAREAYARQVAAKAGLPPPSTSQPAATEQAGVKPADGALPADHAAAEQVTRPVIDRPSTRDAAMGPPAKRLAMSSLNGLLMPRAGMTHGQRPQPGGGAGGAGSRPVSTGSPGTGSGVAAAAAAAGTMAGGAGAGGGAPAAAAAQPLDIVSDLDPEALEALRKHRDAQKRKRALLAAIHQVATSPDLIKEMYDLGLARETKAARLEEARSEFQAAVERRRAAEQEARALMQPSRTWTAPPPLLALQYTDDMQPGSDSFEAREPAYRWHHRPGGRHHPSDDSPAEPNWPGPAIPPAAPAIPWTPLVVQEDTQQNEAIWAKGVRSPFLVRPPPYARAGSLPLPSPPLMFVSYTAPSSHQHTASTAAQPAAQPHTASHTPPGQAPHYHTTQSYSQPAAAAPPVVQTPQYVQHAHTTAPAAHYPHAPQSFNHTYTAQPHPQPVAYAHLQAAAPARVHYLPHNTPAPPAAHIAQSPARPGYGAGYPQHHSHPAQPAQYAYTAAQPQVYHTTYQQSIHPQHHHPPHRVVQVLPAGPPHVAPPPPPPSHTVYLSHPTQHPPGQPVGQAQAGAHHLQQSLFQGRPL